MAWNKFRNARPGDLLSVWQNLRPEDYQEYDAIGFTDPELIDGYIFHSHLRLRTWDSDKGPLAILGVSPDDDPNVGVIWAIARVEAMDRWRFAVRHTEGVLAELGQGFKVLSNFKDARNSTQINWLRRLGFVFFRTEENFLGSRKPFHQFMRIVK